MIKRLLLFTITLITSLIAVMVVLVAPARQHPSPGRLAMLRLTDCPPPCWVGVTVGKTRLSEAIEQLKRVYAGDTRVQFDIRVPLPGTAQVALRDVNNPSEQVLVSVNTLGNSNDLIVRNLIFILDEPTSPHYQLGELFQYIGPPRGVNFTYSLPVGDGSYFSFNYQEHSNFSISVIARPASPWMDMSQRVTTFEYIEFGSTSNATALESLTQPWKGFTTLSRYKP